jgi:putative molybdopterin biosynthesis protein
VKRPSPSLDARTHETVDALLTTGDVARLLRVHPKHVYRLFRRGLPGHRVGGQWRYSSQEVLRWCGADDTGTADRGASAVTDSGSQQRGPVMRSSVSAPPSAFLAANGDIAVESLLGALARDGHPLLGFVQADRSGAFDLLRRGEVLAAGCHGSAIPAALDGRRLAFIHLVDRQIGLAVRRRVRFRGLRDLQHLRFASRPPTAGVRDRLDEELTRQGIDPQAVHGRALMMPSHREVVCAVARGDADVGVASASWTKEVGLKCLPLCQEEYGLLVLASSMGDPRIVALCEVVQSAVFRKQLGAIFGYETRRTGVISYGRARGCESAQGREPAQEATGRRSRSPVSRRVHSRP